MNVTWIDGPMWRVRALADSASRADVAVRWCTSPSDSDIVRDVCSIVLDPFCDSKFAVFVGRQALECKSIAESLHDLAGMSSRLTLVVFYCPNSVAPSLRRVADESGSYRKWDTTLGLDALSSELNSVFGKQMPEGLSRRLSWCVSTSSWSDDVDADVARMECIKLATIHGSSVPSEDDVVMACFRQRGEAMKFILNAVEAGDVDGAMREASRGERLLGGGFYGLAISALIQLWRGAKLDAMRSSAGWSREAALEFMKPEKDGKSSPMFNPRAVDKADRSEPKPYGKSMATAMFSSICVASRMNGELQEQMWKTRFYAVLLLACNIMSPKDVDVIFRATEVS